MIATDVLQLNSYLKWQTDGMDINRVALIEKLKLGRRSVKDKEVRRFEQVESGYCSELKEWVG